MSPLSRVPAGVRLGLKVTPNASADRVRGVVNDAAGVALLQVFVTAVPEDGKANRAVIAVLAKRWKLAKSAIGIVRGATDRRKILEIRTDDPDGVCARILGDIQPSS
jgi:hypothetical protein